MIDFLALQLYPLTVLLTVALLTHNQLLKKLGANGTYALWATIPLALLLFNIPFDNFIRVNSEQSLYSQYIILPKVALQQINYTDLFGAVWLGISACLIVFACLSHIKFNNNLFLTKVSKGIENVCFPKGLILYRSSHVYSPMLVGLLKQKLVIPEDFEEIYSIEQQQLILQHEICHFDRNDIYWNLLAFSFITLFWFHPLVWLSYFRFRRDQELSCDQTVLARKQTESRVTYSKALLVTAETTPPLSFAKLSFNEYGDKKIMFERLKHIKTVTKSSSTTLAIVSVLSISLLSAVSVAGSIGKEKSDLKGGIKKEAYPVIRIEPKYPTKAAKEGTEGAVVLKFDINADGNVKNVSVVKALPKGVFDKVAKVALRQWKYEPSDSYHKDQLVQLDFRMGPDSSLDTSNMLEKINVTH
ncbi:TonB family protein [Colwellia sp. RSH04]|uniref:M56 family metallopeptidase n=1 Tax=Colwellia sp. RSH04 TaxID=2305464 RepID=UPI000E59088D|nr:M56 family metallopeptidase [Colwellia sp. RSH04]RHW75478.1 M56 family peptidase [Colwellia sp. RSH04]